MGLLPWAKTPLLLAADYDAGGVYPSSSASVAHLPLTLFKGRRFVYTAPDKVDCIRALVSDIHGAY